MFTCLEYFAEVSRTLRSIQPAHYLFRVDSVSVLLKTCIKKYNSGDFEAGGYKWWVSFESSFPLFLLLFLLKIKILLHLQEIVSLPNGNEKSVGEGHISLYLEISEIEKLPVGWEVTVIFKLFVYNHIHEKYLTVQGRVFLS